MTELNNVLYSTKPLQESVFITELTGAVKELRGIEMYNKEKACIKAISQYCGKRLDYIQGGGGNTSYKFDDRIMAVKASGYSLLEVEEDRGYVTVDFTKIKDKYEELSKNRDVDVEKETLNINMNSISLLEGMENRRPSVEVGFHAYLKRAVVHTHSVYSNLLCCSEQGKEIAVKIFGASEYGYIYISFINPGFKLSMHIKEECEKYEAENGKVPELIFMENHGIIVSHEDYNVAIAIHEKANRMIADYFGAKAFPKPMIFKIDGGYESKTDFLKFFICELEDEQYFDKTILYPDQLVYLGDNVGKTILMDPKKGTIEYRMSEKQARTIEEVLLGVAYIISEVKRAGLDLKLLCDEGIEFIRNWESEKYRAALVE